MRKGKHCTFAFHIQIYRASLGIKPASLTFRPPQMERTRKWVLKCNFCKLHGDNRNNSTVGCYCWKTDVLRDAAEAYRDWRLKTCFWTFISGNLLQEFVLERLVNQKKYFDNQLFFKTNGKHYLVAVSQMRELWCLSLPYIVVNWNI